jgi:hypothetical protein
MPPNRDELAIAGWDVRTAANIVTFQCGYCGMLVASAGGIAAQSRVNPQRFLRWCPNCFGPTLFYGDEPVIPGTSPGPIVPNLPAELATLYREARDAASSGAFTGAVMVCRTILASLAVQQGAPANQTFQQYVNYLAESGFVPPNGKGWVDFIRTRGNDAIHDIVIMSRDDAVAVIEFTGALLGFVYDFPSRIPAGAGGP